MKFHKSALLVVTLTFMAGATHAMSVPFSWSGGSLNATGAVALASYSPTAGSTSALANGATESGILFGEISLIVVGSGILTVGVDFITPLLSTETVAGAYDVFSVFIFSGGKWTGGSTDFAYNYMGNAGMARLTMGAIDTGLQLGPTFQIRGSITNLGSAVVASLPEPGTLSLLALGLAGISWTRQRKQTT